MTTMTLTEFLLARIAEDEARARRAAGATAWRSDMPPESYVMSRAGERLFTVGIEEQLRADESTLALAQYFAETLPGRVLAECEAKRKIVNALAAREEPDAGMDSAEDRAATWALREACQALTLPYADHPDHRAEWRP